MTPSDLLRTVRDLPGCVGLSVWRVDDGVCSTVAAVDALDVADGPIDRLATYTSSDAAVLDAVQYAASGPGTDAVATGEPVDGSSRMTLHDRWPLLAAAAGARGVTGVIAVPLHVAVPPAGRDDAVHGWTVQGAVVLYVVGRVRLDAAMVRLSEALGAVVLLQHGSVGDRRGVDVAGLVQLRPHLDRRTWTTGLLLEDALSLAPGVGRRRLIGAALRASVSTDEVAETVAEVLAP